MNVLTDFISRRILAAAQQSPEHGRQKYQAFFTESNLYEACRQAVENRIAEAGLLESILMD